MFEELKELDAYFDAFTNYVHELKERSDKKYIEMLSDLRKISIETLNEAEIFFINDGVELLLPHYKGYYEDFGILSSSNTPAFHHRWMIPIKNAEGKVINLVGYTNMDSMRYLYGTAKFYKRSDDLYGMENLNLAYKLGYAIVTEGITDAIALRGLGYKNTFAWCGTMRSNKKIQLLNRCRYGVIRIPDRDVAGQRTDRVQRFKNVVKFTIPYGYKDIAETLENEFVAGTDILMRDYMKEAIDFCISEITKKAHMGMPVAYRNINA